MITINPLPPEVSSHVDHAARMAQDILNPTKEVAHPAHYSTPSYYHSSYYHTSTVHHVHHTSSSSIPVPSRSSRSNKRDDEVLVAIIFGIAAFVLTCAVATELGVNSNANADLKKLAEEREIAEYTLNPRTGFNKEVFQHPKSREILHRLTRIYDVEQDILQTYKSRSNTSLAFKGLTLAATATAAAAAAVSAPAVMFGGMAASGAIMLTWAMHSLYSSGSKEIERKADTILAEIQMLDQAIKC